MALLNDFALPLGLPSVRVYVMVAQAAFNRLDSVVDVHTATFASAQTRQDYKTRKASLETLEAQGKALKTQYDAMQEPGADKSGEAELVRSIKLHQIDFEAAAEAFRRIVPHVDQQPIRVGKDKSESVMTDGAPDLAKVYTHLKTLPQFKNAEDA